MESLKIITASAKETRQLAEALARCLGEGDFLALEGELGAGKTCFVQGLARGLGAPEPVTSPTFNLIHEYRGGRLPLYHFDVYRLREPKELEGLGYEEYFEGDGVCAVEWSDLIGPYLPADRLTLRFTRLEAAAAESPEPAEGAERGARQAEEPARQAELSAQGPKSRRLLEKIEEAWQERQK